jgi:bifunctional non-homologous end joining protein LigD
MSLKEYHKKRNFRRTREPRGRVERRKDWLYAVQKHDASHLHYDFRLQLGGVLKSWAVPKGPSLDPKVKRLAMHVEDHPVEYGDFEGTIPEGEYGGGTVMLWDRGWWEPEGDAERDYRGGKLKFRLHGEKLKGLWMLVRAGGRSPRGNEWLLFKKSDEEARDEEKGVIIDDAPQSVKTGRSLDEIAESGDAVWSSSGGLQTRAPQKRSKRQSASKRTPKARARTRASKTAKSGVSPGKRTTRKNPAKAAGKRKTVSASPRELPGAVEANFHSVVKRVRPQLATLAAEAPAGDQWLHEIKFDGYRMICRKDGAKVQLFSRNENDWTGRFGGLVQSLGELPFEQAILDGEVCALATGGKSDFQELQNAMKEGRARRMVYYAFDVLYADGFDLTKVELLRRKEFLEATLPARLKMVVYSKHVIGKGPAYFKEACKLGLEGIICKRADRPYYMGRSADWLKVKCIKREEFVIGGFTDPAGSRVGFGSLLVGYYDKRHQLTYAGRVGTGFDTRSLRELTVKLERIEQPKSPFHDLTTRTAEARHAHWVRPQLVGQVEFTEWTADGRLRHPSFQGLREDKPAAEVVRDRPAPLTVVANASSSNGNVKHQASASTSLRRTAKSDNANDSSNLTMNGRGSHKSDRVDIAGVSLSSPGKVLYREQGITKLQLAQYYEAIADWVLPEVVGRPLVLVRCPEGTDKPCFFQKHPGAGSSERLRQIPVKEKSKTENYLVADDLAGVISLVQMGVLEIHSWGSRADRIEQPDRLIFDLDPDPSVKFTRLVEAAFEVRQFLDDLGLVSFVKTTGGKGLHVVVPVSRRREWDEMKEFCRLVATAIVRAAPEHYTANMSKAARVGKIYVDYLRNGRGASAIVPYSTRARSGAPVAMPVAWDDLRRLEAANQFTIQNAVERLRRQKKDPWADIGRVRQTVSAAARKKLEGLRGS